MKEYTEYIDLRQNKDIGDSITNLTFFAYCECQKLLVIILEVIILENKTPKCQSSLTFNVLRYLYYIV